MKAFLFFESPVRDYSLISEQLEIYKRESRLIMKEINELNEAGTPDQAKILKCKEDFNKVKESIEICESIIKFENTII